MKSATLSKPCAKGREPMENLLRTLLKPIFLAKEKNDLSEKKRITKEIREIEIQLKNVQNRFDLYTDFDMTDSCIYEMEALEARYRYLLKKAKEEKVQNIPVFSVSQD